MDFRLTDEQALLRETIREFAEGEIAPNAATWDEEEHFPAEIIPQLAEIGVMGIPIPEEYGGVGMGNLEYAMAVEELSKACASTGVTVSAHTSLCCWPIYRSLSVMPPAACRFILSVFPPVYRFLHPGR